MPDCRARFAAVAVPAVASLLIAMLCAAPAAADTASFTSPGCSPWTVPTGVTGLSIDAVGGAGGGATGASGDQVSGTLSVSHGQVLDVCVNLGGGTAGSGAGAGAGAGGGASGVGLGTDFGMPVIVAAGGGGAGGGGVAAGAGGSPGKSGGSGGGSAGTGASISAPGVPNGTRFGPGGPGAGGDGSGKGGGGGGGYYGGGGGGGSGLSGGGGGGGSDFCDTSRVRGCSTHAPTTSPEVVFSYTVTSPPTASISSPANGAVYAPGQPVDSSFTCTEGASGPRVSSCADQSGRGSGAAIDTSTPGTHRFTVTAVSGDGLSSSSSVSYLVAAPPRIFLALPANGATFTIGQAVHSFFQCGDGAGGPGLKSCLDQNGQPSGAAIDTSTPGRHTFTVTATSQDGLVASVGAVYQVVPPPTVLSVQAHRGGIVTLLVKVYGPGAIDVMNTARFRSFALAAHAAAGIQPPRGSFVFGSAHVVSSTTRTLAVRVGLTQAGKLLLRDHRRATINVLVLYTGSGGVPQPVKSVALRVSR